jgi:predicted nucleic acid-binding protein
MRNPAVGHSATVVHLARTYQLSAYDAAYRELAIRRGLPLACNDGKLKTASVVAGVVLFSPPAELIS